MPPPVPRCSGWASSSLISPDRISLPRYGGRVGLHIDLFGACSAFTRVAACTLAQSPIVTANRRLQPFRYLHDCSDCFRLERIAGWGLHPLESAAFARRTPNAAGFRARVVVGPLSTTKNLLIVESCERSWTRVPCRPTEISKALAIVLVTLQVERPEHPAVPYVNEWRPKPPSRPIRLYHRWRPVFSIVGRGAPS